MPIGPSETVGKSRESRREEEVEGLTCLDGDGRGAERGGVDGRGALTILPTDAMSPCLV